MSELAESAPSQSSPTTIACTLLGEGNASFWAHIVRPGKQTLKWRERQYAMAAIGEIYKSGPAPPHVNIAELTRQVNEVLKRNPEYCASGLGRKVDPGKGEIDHMTVHYALRAYREANP